MTKGKHASINTNTSKNSSHKKEHALRDSFGTIIAGFYFVSEHNKESNEVDEEEDGGELHRKVVHVYITRKLLLQYSKMTSMKERNILEVE